MENRDQTIFVDADACPVKGEIVEIAKLYEVRFFFIASYAHAPAMADPHWIFVDSEKEEVDMYIVNHAKKNDIVITQDHGLASLLLPRSIFVLSPRGKQFSEDEMMGVLQQRYLSAKLRKSGKYSKGPRKMSKGDRERFRVFFKKILSINEGKKE